MLRRIRAMSSLTIQRNKVHAHETGTLQVSLQGQAERVGGGELVCSEKKVLTGRERERPGV